MKNLYKLIEVNEDVNVFVVGDIHGCYDLLMTKLDEIGFNKKTDLLISVGDLVDRGHQSVRCTTLITESWFECVRGNHEQFCIDGLLDPYMKNVHIQNGGQWFYDLPEQVQESLYRIFNELPYMIEVRFKGKRFGFVHANLPYESWDFNKQELLENGATHNGRSVKSNMIWSRDMVEFALYNNGTFTVSDIDNVFFGHTIQENGVLQVGNCTFLDTGAFINEVYKVKGQNDYGLTILNLRDFC